MPCITDHMEPNERERHRKRAAKLAVFVAGVKGVPAPEGCEAAAKHYYGEGVDGDEVVAWLCGVMNGHHSAEEAQELGRITNPDARDLAEWWEEHKAVDAARELKEKREALAMNADAVVVVWDQYGHYHSTHAVPNKLAAKPVRELVQRLDGAYQIIGGAGTGKWGDIMFEDAA